MIKPENIKAPGAGAATASKAGAVQGGAAQAGQASVEGAGAAFRALLERLERSAKDLDVASEAIDHPRQLGEAVETARASVEEALLAGSHLLEAYRAAQAHAAAGESNTNTEETNHSSTERARTGHGEAK